MSKDLMPQPEKKPAQKPLLWGKGFVKWFSGEAISNWGYEQLGVLGRSAIMTTTVALVVRFFSAIPLDLLLITVLFLFGLVFFSLQRLIDRRRKQAQPVIETGETNVDKMALKSAASVEKVECPYQWTHNIAETERGNIQRAVSVIGSELQCELSDQLPYIDFKFAVLNSSVYSISIDNVIEGYISFHKRRLMGNMRMERSLNNLSHASRGDFVVRLQLSREEVDFISNANDPDRDYFSLHQLNIKVKGKYSRIEVEPELLKLPDFISISSDGKRIDELKNQIDRLNKQIEGLNQEIGRLQREVGTQKTIVNTREDERNSLQSELDAHKWLHEMADVQARNITEYVRVERVLLCDLRLRDPIQIPYVEFWLDIINTSVYDITVHTDTIKGCIKFALNNLLEGKEIIYPEKSIPPSSRVNVNIKQRLNTTEVNLLAPYVNNKEEALLLFNLNDLGIVISGGTQFPQVERKYLTISQKEETTLKIEILRAIYRGYVSQNEGLLGMIANINVRLTNLRRTRIDIKSFRLRIMLQGTAYVSYAAHGEIYEGKFKDNKGEIKSVGRQLQNLNFNNESPIGIEPEQSVGGWLQFSVDGQFASDDDSKPSATLTIVDTLGNEHNENCKLTSRD